VTGTSPALSADGSTLAYVSRSGDETSVMAARREARGGRQEDPRADRRRGRLAGRFTPRVPGDAERHWEIRRHRSRWLERDRVTREIQHDVSPRFVTNTLLIAATGESRHLRSSLYDLQTLRRTRLFHNNTVRTIAPEYAWVPSADGRQVLVTAERDGDTVSPERGLYLVSLDRRVTVPEVLARIDASLAAEKALRARASGCSGRC